VKKNFGNGAFPVALLAVSLGILTAPPALLAHHGSAMYDETKTVMVKGVVTEWVWANPHCLLEMDVKNDQGESVHWTAEVSNPPDMMARGWSRKMFKPGDEVTVWMIVAKNGDPIGRIERIIVNGKTYEGMRSAPAETTKNQKE
jgi:hypothetical protein